MLDKALHLVFSPKLLINSIKMAHIRSFVAAVNNNSPPHDKNTHDAKADPDQPGHLSLNSQSGQSLLLPNA